MGFCLRLALVDVMYREEKPFLVLDDPFVNLDDEKMPGARLLLREAAKGVSDHLFYLFRVKSLKFLKKGLD